MTEPAKTGLDRLFEPRSIAVVGASPTNPWARQALANLLDLGYPGRLAAVNPRYQEVLGVACYPRLEDVPFTPDAVMITLSRDQVLPVLEACARVGAGGAVVFAIGFAEAGSAGVALQERLGQIAQEAGMALIGPNCQGLINWTATSALYLRRVHPYSAGNVGLISQSGSITSAIVNGGAGLRFASVASTGNEAVTTTGHVLGRYIGDPAIATVLIFAETIRQPERFLAECDRARDAGKPIVMVKVGRSEPARQAGLSHSGALSPPDRLVDALLRRHGVIRVDTLEDLVATGLAVSVRAPAGRRAAAVTISGAQAAVLHDAAGPSGMEFPGFTEATATRLQALLPPQVRAANPLDVWGMPEPATNYMRCLEAVVEDPLVDTVIVMAETRQHPTGHPDAHRLYIDSATALAAASAKSVVLLSATHGGADSNLAQELAPRGVTVLSGFTTALRALSSAAAWRESRPSLAPGPTLDVAGLRAAVRQLRGTPTSGSQALAILAQAGFPTVPFEVASDPEEAMAAASRLGFPVVVKSDAPALLHKTESAAVVLDLRTAVEVRSAGESIQARVPGSLLVQPMVPAQAEFILALTSEPGLGTFVLVGAGGVMAEVLSDVAIRPIPLMEGDAASMLGALRIAGLLDGFRGSAPLDREALIESVERLAALGAALGPAILSLDINPVVVGVGGVLLLDAVVVPNPADATWPPIH